jgi:hypothetical protein
MRALRRQAFGLVLIASFILLHLVLRHWGHLNLNAR